uniref:Uncharacterized protein n=1 Tax=Romanomermis culicivorax TaxID=13658 RepID=A0A915L789_ROMCU
MSSRKNQDLILKKYQDPVPKKNRDGAHQRMRISETRQSKALRCLLCLTGTLKIGFLWSWLPGKGNLDFYGDGRVEGDFQKKRQKCLFFTQKL